jgi:hypothetical protein
MSAVVDQTVVRMPLSLTQGTLSCGIAALVRSSVSRLVDCLSRLVGLAIQPSRREILLPDRCAASRAVATLDADNKLDIDKKKEGSS